MENNENNVQNQEKKQSKGLSVGLVIIMLIAVLIIGIGGGYLLSKNNSLFNKNEAKSNSNSNNTTQSNNNTSVENNTVEQNKTGKKIDESKSWVYNMNIEEKEFEYEYEEGRDTYKASENFKVPYININSEDAKKVNEEILSVYNNALQNFGKIPSEGARTISGIEYNAYENGKYLSVVLTEFFGYVNGSGSKIGEYAYTFNLDTLKLVTFKEAYKDKGYEEKNIEERINKFVEQAKKDIYGGPEDNNSTIYFNNDFYIDGQGKIKILVANKHTEWNKTVLTYVTYDIDDTVINNTSSNRTISNNTNTKTTSEEYAKYYIEKIKSLDYTNNSTKYGLLDISGSNIPYLIVDTSGNLSIYKINNNAVETLKERDSYGTHGRDGYDYIEGTKIMRDYCTFEEGYAYEIYDELFDYKYCVECTFNGEYRYSSNSGEKKTITEEEFNKLSYKNSQYKHLRDVTNKSKEEMIKVLENK